MVDIGAHRANVVVPAPLGPVGPPPGGGGHVGGHPAVAVPPGPGAVAIAAAPAPPPPPALPTFEAYKSTTHLDGLLAKLVDKRSTELKDVDAKVQTILPLLTQAPGKTDAEFLTAFAALKKAKTELDGSAQAWDPAQHSRGPKVSAHLTQIQNAFAPLQARYDALINQDPAGNAIDFARSHGIDTHCVDAIVRSAPDPQAAIQSLCGVMNDARVLLDGAGLTAQERNHVAVLLATADATADGLVKVYAQGQNGNTAAHDLARQPTQLAALQGHLTAQGGDLNSENAVGHTPLTIAITTHGDTAMIRDLIGKHADVNSDGLLGIFKPLDLARAINRSAVLPDLLAAGATSGVDAQQLRPSQIQGMTTDAILMRGTLAQDAGCQTFIQGAFTNILAEARLAPLLDLAAQKMVGDPGSEMTALRINHLGFSDAKLLTGMPSAGAYNPDTHTLNLASKASQRDVQGTIVHELTHHAVDEIWHNDDMPFPAADLAKAQAGQSLAGTLMESYITAIQADGAHAGGHVDASKVRATVLDRVQGGYGSRGTVLNLPQGTFTTATLQEYVVGIPQAINDFGYAAVQATTPNLLAFYEAHVLPAATQMAQTLAQRTLP